jgi:hypothetical protein
MTAPRGPYEGYTWEQVAKMKETLLREANKEADKKKSIMVPDFFRRMKDECEIPYVVSFAVFKVWGFIHKDVSFTDYMERNGLL